MTEERYRQLLRGRGRPGAQLALASPVVAGVLRRAAKSVRRCQRAEQALEGVLRPEWLRRTLVDSFESGTLVLRVSEAPVFEQMRRQAGRLQQQVARRVDGVRRVRVMMLE